MACIRTCAALELGDLPAFSRELRAANHATFVEVNEEYFYPNESRPFGTYRSEVVLRVFLLNPAGTSLS